MENNKLEDEVFPLLMYREARPTELQYAQHYQQAARMHEYGFVKLETRLIGDSLQKIRAENNATQREMSRFLSNRGFKISHSWYNKLEKGTASVRSLTPDRLTQLANALRVERYQLYSNKARNKKLYVRGLFRSKQTSIELLLFVCHVTVNGAAYSFHVTAKNAKHAAELIRKYVDQKGMGVIKWISIHRLLTESRITAVIRPEHEGFVEYLFREYEAEGGVNHDFREAIRGSGGFPEIDRDKIAESKRARTEIVVPPTGEL